MTQLAALAQFLPWTRAPGADNTQAMRAPWNTHPHTTIHAVWTRPLAHLLWRRGGTSLFRSCVTARSANTFFPSSQLASVLPLTLKGSDVALLPDGVRPQRRQSDSPRRSARACARRGAPRHCYRWCQSHPHLQSVVRELRRQPTAACHHAWARRRTPAALPMQSLPTRCSNPGPHRRFHRCRWEARLGRQPNRTDCQAARTV